MNSVSIPNQPPPVDPALSKKELQKRLNLKNNFEYYAPMCLRIRPKTGKVRPFTLNRAQIFLHRVAERQRQLTGKVRIMVLKGRQQGISTYIEGRFYWRTTHTKGVQAYILTHEQKATDNLFKMAQRYHDNCPPDMQPVTGSQSSKELNFAKLDSGYSVGTAGTKAVGRSSTTQYFHGSEVAFWPNASEHAMGVMQGVPEEPDTEVFLESTANGIGNYFHGQWQLAELGETDFIAVFLPWYWQDEYVRSLPADWQLNEDEMNLLQAYSDDGLTEEHLCWRRHKVLQFTADGDDGEWRFKQEYPFTSAEAFQTSGDDSLINPKYVMSARKKELELSGTAAHVVGVDPSRFGKDPAAIVHRQGRKAWGTWTKAKLSTMELAGNCARILRDPYTGEDTDVDMMFIDVGGLGAGVYDRLIELGFEDRVTEVNFGGRALDDQRYKNKRTEIWCLMNEWFQLPGGVDVEDKDAMQADVCGPRYTYDSASRYVLEKKESMMDRGLRSPNIGDALACTFAEPVAPPNRREQAQRNAARRRSRPADAGVGY